MTRFTFDGIDGSVDTTGFVFWGQSCFWASAAKPELRAAIDRAIWRQRAMDYVKDKLMTKANPTLARALSRHFLNKNGVSLKMAREIAADVSSNYK